VPSSASGRLTASCDFDLSGGDFSMYADVSSLPSIPFRERLLRTIAGYVQIRIAPS
jgi:hypothetical protein